MASVTKCDRCGDIFDEGKIPKSRYKVQRSTAKIFQDLQLYDADLCIFCTEALEDFMKNQQGENEK